LTALVTGFGIAATLLCVAAGLVCPCVAAAAATPPLELDGRMGFRRYDAHDGLTNTTISGITQTTDGLLWVGSENGLFRWDGRHFSRFGRDDGLPANLITRLAAAPDGTLWVGTQTGLGRVAAGKVTPTADLSGLPEGERIYELGFDGDGRLLVGTGKALFRQKGVAALAFEPVPGISGRIGSVFCERDGTVLVVGGDSIWSIEPGQAPTPWLALPAAGGTAIETLARDGSGRLWLRKGQHLFELRGGRFVDRAELIHEGASWGGLTVDRAGRLWIPATNHIAVVAGDHVRVLGPDDGLPSDSATFKVFVDHEGALWLGGIGLLRQLGRGLWTRHGKEEGLPSPLVWSITRGPDGTLWAGTETGLARLGAPNAADRWLAIAGGEGEIETVTVAADGRVWFGATNDNALRAFDPTTSLVAEYGPVQGYGGGSVRMVRASPDGHIYALPYGGGLYTITANGASVSFDRVEIAGIPAEATFRDLTVGAGGRLWLAGEGGLWRVDADRGHARHYSVADGLAGVAVSLVLERDRGEFCVAYAEGLGLSCFEVAPDGALVRARHLGVEDGLGSPVVWILGEDAKRQLWAATDHGVTVFTAAGADWFTTDEGLPNDDFAEHSFWAEPDGDVWLGSASGLAHFHSRRYLGPSPSPAPIITAVRLGTQTLAPPWPSSNGPWPSIPHHGAALDVRFAVPVMAQERKVVAEARLIGVDLAWQDLEAWDARYPTLPPGDYRLEIRARVGKSPASAPAILAFTVRPAWWQTWPARIAQFVLAGLLVGLFVRWRVRSLQQNLAAARQRQREIEVLNDELRHQVAERSRALGDILGRLSEASADTSTMSAGDVIDGRFGVEAKIGQGAMGVVYRVRRLADGQELGLKVLTNVVSTRQLARFAREAQIGAQFVHENVVRVLDLSFASAGYMYVVMEYIDGESLKSLKPRWPELDFSLHVLRDIAAGLGALHDHGIVHRDLKPANVLVTGTKGGAAAGTVTAKIVDFGVSSLAGSSGESIDDGELFVEPPPAQDSAADTERQRPVRLTVQPPLGPDAGALASPASSASPPAAVGTDSSPTTRSRGLAADQDDRTAATAAIESSAAERAAQSAAAAARMSSLGSKAAQPATIVGTPAYMAPELVLELDAVRPALDLFAFGVLATEMLAGRRPFGEPPCLVVASGRRLETPPPLAIAGVPRELTTLIDACLAFDPRRRPSAEVMVRALDAALARRAETRTAV
jgi:serine/threonine protein kinase/ligand-binding sensor domain-containing protein